MRVIQFLGHLQSRVLLLTLFLHLLLSALLLVVVIDVAALALALSIDEPDISVYASSSHALAPILVIAVVAHALGVENGVFVRTSCHDALFPT